MEIKEMPVQELIERANVRGIRTRGMTKDAIVEAIESTDAGKILETGDDVPKSARYQELEERIKVLEEKVFGAKTADSAKEDLSWDDLRKLAAQNNVQVHGKKREQIEEELRRIEDE